MNAPKRTLEQAEAEISRLNSIIKAARSALNENRGGDLRRLLENGRSDALKSHTGVIARDGGGG